MENIETETDITKSDFKKNLFVINYLEKKEEEDVKNYIVCYLCADVFLSQRNFAQHLLEKHYADGEDILEQHGIQYLAFLNKRFKNNEQNEQFNVQLPFCHIRVHFNDKSVYNTQFNSLTYILTVNKKDHHCANKKGVYNFNSMTVVDVFIEIAFQLLRKLETTYRYFRDEFTQEFSYSTNSRILYYTSKQGEYDTYLTHKHLQTRSTYPFTSVVLDNEIKNRIKTYLNGSVALNTAQQGSGFILRGVYKIQLVMDRSSQLGLTKYIGGPKSKAKKRRQSQITDFILSDVDVEAPNKKLRNVLFSMNENEDEEEIEETVEAQTISSSDETSSSEDEQSIKTAILYEDYQKRVEDNFLTKNWRNSSIKKLNPIYVQKDDLFKHSPTELSGETNAEIDFKLTYKIDDNQYKDILEKVDRALKVVNNKIENINDFEQMKKYDDPLMESFLNEIWKKIRKKWPEKQSTSSSATKIQFPNKQPIFENINEEIEQYQDQELDFLFNDITPETDPTSATEFVEIDTVKAAADELDIQIFADPDDQNAHALKLFHDRDFTVKAIEKINAAKKLSSEEVKKVIKSKKKLVSSEKKRLETEKEIVKIAGNKLNVFSKRLDKAIEKSKNDSLLKNQTDGMCLIDAVTNGLIKNYRKKTGDVKTKKLICMYGKKTLEQLMVLQNKTRNLPFLKCYKVFDEINELLMQHHMYLNVLIYTRTDEGVIIPHIMKKIKNEKNEGYLMTFGDFVYRGYFNDNSPIKLKIDDTINIAIEYDLDNEMHATLIDDINNWSFTYHNNEKNLITCMICPKCSCVLSTKHKQRNIENHLEVCYGNYKIEKKATSNNTYSSTNYYDKLQKAPFTVYSDLETTTKEDESYKPIAVGYVIVENREFFDDDKQLDGYHAFSITAVDDIEEMISLNLPKKFLPYYEKKDIYRLSQLAEQINLDKIEFGFYVDFLHASISRMLGNYISEIANMNKINDSEINAYRMKFLSLPADKRTCNVCDFPIDTTSTDKDIKRIFRNQEVIMFYCEKFFIKAYSFNPDVGMNNKTFKEKIKKVVAIFEKIKQPASQVAQKNEEDLNLESDNILINNKVFSIFLKAKNITLLQFRNQMLKMPMSSLEETKKRLKNIPSYYDMFISYKIFLYIAKDIFGEEFITTIREFFGEELYDLIDIISKYIFETDFVVEHDHYNPHKTKKIRGCAHRRCNNLVQKKMQTKIFFINGSKFDISISSHFFSCVNWQVPEPYLIGNSGSTIAYMGVTFRRQNVMFADTIQFFPSSLANLVSNLSPESKDMMRKIFDKYLKKDAKKGIIYKCLPPEKKNRLLDLLTECKGVIPYELIVNRESLLKIDDEFDQSDFKSRLKGEYEIKKADYDKYLELKEILDMHTIGESVKVYVVSDTIGLAVACEKKFNIMCDQSRIDPRNFTSMSSYGICNVFMMNKTTYCQAYDEDINYEFKTSIIGGMSSVATRLSFNTKVFDQSIRIVLPKNPNFAEENKHLSEEEYFLKYTNQEKQEFIIQTIPMNFDVNGLYASTLENHIPQYGYKQVSVTDKSNRDDYETYADWLKAVNFDQIEKDTDPNEELIGHFLIAEIDFDCEHQTKRKLREQELANLAFERVSPRLIEQSSYFFLNNLKQDTFEIDFTKATSKPKLLSNLHTKIFKAHVQNFRFLVTQLNCKIRVIRHYTYVKRAWAYDYVHSRQVARQQFAKEGNSEASGLMKYQSNSTYGGIAKCNDKESAQPIINPTKEFKDFDSYNKSLTENEKIFNPFATEELILPVIQNEYDKKIELLNLKLENDEISQSFYEIECESQKLKFERQTEDMYKNIEKVKRKRKRKHHKTEDNELRYQMEKGGKKVRIHQRAGDENSSVRMVVMIPENKRKKDMRSAATKILDDAKLNNPIFNLKLLRSTYPENYDEVTKQKAEEYGIQEVQVIYVGGDTDSSKFNFAVLLNKDSTATHEQTQNWLQRQIVTFCSELIDKSHPYFDSFGIRNLSQKKKAGLMSFDECTSGVSTLDDPVIYGIYTNPKEYCEQSLSSYNKNKNFENKSVKHKSVSRSNKEITLNMYHNRLRSATEIINECIETGKLEPLHKVYQAGLQRTNEGVKFVDRKKNCLNRLSDKVAFFSNGLISITYGHPDWEKFVVKKRILKYDDRNECEKSVYAIDEKEIIKKLDILEDIKNERNVIIRNRHLEVYNTFLNLNIEGILIKDCIYNQFTFNRRD